MLFQERRQFPAKPASLPEKKVNLPSCCHRVVTESKGVGTKTRYAYVHHLCINPEPVSYKRSLADRQWVALN